MQRPIPRLRQHAIGLDHRQHVVVLDRDLEVVEIILLEEGSLPDCRLNQGLGRGTTVLLQQARIQRSRVHADTQRNTVIRSSLANVLHLVVELANIARVHAHGAAARLDRLEHILRFEVDVRDDGDTGLLRDNRQRLGILIRRARHADNVTARGSQLRNLLQRRANIMRLRRRHGLNRHRRAPAHRNISHHQAMRLLARKRRRSH